MDDATAAAAERHDIAAARQLVERLSGAVVTAEGIGADRLAALLRAALEIAQAAAVAPSIELH